MTLALPRALSLVLPAALFACAASAQSTLQPLTAPVRFEVASAEPLILALPADPSSVLYSSSSSPVTVEAAPSTDKYVMGVISYTAAQPTGPSKKPFHTVAAGLKVGSQGIGFEVATRLAERINLRSTVQFLELGGNFTSDGVQATGRLSMQNIGTSVDFYPFNNGFRISPGFTIHNDTHLSASLLAPGGTTLTLGDQDYTSDPSNPITGYTTFTLGSKYAPRLTMGWGNMIPRRGGHFAIPFEAGFQYISAPTVTLQLSGNGCSVDGCGSINDPSNQQNITDEVTKLTSDLAPLRIYPIISTGITYRFGRSYNKVQ